MSTADFSRYLYQPEKRYVGAFLQQGRVLTDEDLNEHRRLAAEDERLTFRDIICARGSPNQGFRISGLTTGVVGGVTAVEFEAAAGCYYLGGLRFAVLEGLLETFLHQSDWLQIDLDPSLLTTPPSAADLTDASGNAIERYDLVYLRGWEQNVTATEDSELLERALGGPDTSVYRRRMRRIEVLPDVPGDCAEAFNQLLSVLTAPGAGDSSGIPHTFDGPNSQLLSKARLTVGFSGTGPSDDLCKPKVTQGYLGAENQAIRVQLTDTNRFVWGNDNASPLYRVQIATEDGLDQVKFLTLPRDEFTQPKAGQSVEILPWGALLPNQEKVSELSGHLTLVDTGYDPDTQTIVIHESIPTEWIDWLDAPEHAGFLSDNDATEDQKYFYLRVWTGVADDPTEPDTEFAPGDTIDLGDTGLSVTFSDRGRPGDYWIIAARPNTPDRVVPWGLLDQSPPFGPNWYFGSLALLRWRLIAGGVVGDVIDCRTRFRPLCQLKGCCTIIVGDGTTSHGEFSQIQDAIEALPPEGGEVCVLRGEYRENVSITDRVNVTIRGCGPDTLVIGTSQDPVFEIVDSNRIELTNLAIEADGMIGIAAGTSKTDQLLLLRLTRLTIDSRDRAAIVVEKANNVSLLESNIRVRPLSEPLGTGASITPEPAVYLQGDVLRVEKNRIFADEARAPLRGFGGLQIGGDSQDVEIRRNHIRNGNNHGITLGSVVVNVIEGEPTSGHHHHFPGGPGFTIVIDDEGCIHIVPNPPTDGGGDGGSTTQVEAAPPLFDVRIIDNLIEAMGGSGISVARFFDMESSPDFISVIGLLIEANRIRGCMLLEIDELPQSMRDVTGFGGVALADVDALVVRDNVIRDNGTDNIDPISGVFVLHVEGAMFDRNVILDNGAIDTAERPLHPGRRGGIVLALARAPVVPVPAPFSEFADRPSIGSRQNGIPAAHVHDNVVVSSAGRALEILALGPVSIEGNELTAKGSIFRNQLPIPDATHGNSYGSASVLAALDFKKIAAASNPLLAIIDLLGGSAVAVVNLGVSNEVYLQLFGMSGLFMIDDLPTPEAVAGTEPPRFFVGGNILFNDNQVVFDAFAPGISFTLSSVLLLTLDDISMEGNQCDCDTLLDLALLNALVLGWSIRVADNRFKEPIVPRHYSAVTLALMNHTNNNQSTHCIYAIGTPSVSNRTGNSALIEMNSDSPCKRFGDKLHEAYKPQFGFIPE